MKPWYGTGATDTGRIRANNQDAFQVRNDLGLWIVADGMGSHPHSHLASQTAIRSITAFLVTHSGSVSDADHHQWKTLLNRAIKRAHEDIRQQCDDSPELEGMGTTVVLAFMPTPTSPHLYLAHAGDSRAYLLRNNTLRLLTRDHTLLEEHIREGLLPKNTPASHRLGHVLTKAIGIDGEVDADCIHHTLQPTDRILLCSDGLNKMLEDDDIFDCLGKSESGAGDKDCQRLISKAIRLGGYDNITVVVIDNQQPLEGTAMG